MSRAGAGRAKRVALAAAIGLVSLNVWTGGPLFALWVGSRVQGDGPPAMGAIAVVAVVLLAVSLLFVRALAILNAAYEDATGQRSHVRAHAPWLRSMRGERERYAGEPPRLTGTERMLVVMVILVVALFEVWFFFFSSSPIDQRTGRSSLHRTLTDSTGGRRVATVDHEAPASPDPKTSPEVAPK